LIGNSAEFENDISPLMLTQYEYHTLPHKYRPLLPPHTNREIFLAICELLDKMSGSPSDNYDGADHAIGDRLNKVIVGVDKGSKAMCKNHPKAVRRKCYPTLMPSYHNANFQPDPKVSIKVKLYPVNIYIYVYYVFIKNTEQSFVLLYIMPLTSFKYS